MFINGQHQGSVNCGKLCIPARRQAEGEATTVLVHVSKLEQNFTLFGGHFSFRHYGGFTFNLRGDISQKYPFYVGNYLQYVCQRRLSTLPLHANTGVISDKDVTGIAVQAEGAF